MDRSEASISMRFYYKENNAKLNPLCTTDERKSCNKGKCTTIQKKSLLLTKATFILAKHRSFVKYYYNLK